MRVANGERRVARVAGLALAVLLCSSGGRAQTFDGWGGKITNTDGSTATTCSAFNPNYNATGVSLSRTANVTTATIGSGSWANVVAAVGVKMSILVLNASDATFDATAYPGVLATVTSATTLTYANTGSNGTATGAIIAAASPWLEKVNSHWWYCTPVGHEFWTIGPTFMPGSVHGSSNLPGVVQRLQAWNMNTIQVGSNSNLYPTNASQTQKTAFITSVNAAYYSVTETQTCGGLPLANPVKDLFLIYPSAYLASGGYGGYEGVADMYDASMATWWADDLSCDSPWSGMKNSAYLSLWLGNAGDDSDGVNGISGGGADFPTLPSGHNTINLGYFVLMSSPLEVAAHNPMQRTSGCNGGTSNCNFVYTNTQNYSKLALEAALKTEYSSSISALNTAWGSSYTTFDSSGTCVGSQPITCASSVAVDSVGTGDGSTLTFSTTLSHHTGISAFSVQVLVAGVPVAGVNSAEGSASYSWIGPNVASGSVNPTTGALSITFTAGHAPANLAAITAAYVDCGWGCGTGLLDEDDRTAHHTYLGNNFTTMAGAATAVIADVGTTFDQAIAGQYFSTVRNGMKAVYPSIPFLGPNTLGTWGAPPFAPVLKAAGQYCDAFIAGGSGQLYSTAEMTYIFNNYGDKPLIQGWYTTANPDSSTNLPSSINPNPLFDYATQALRATAYYNGLNGQLTTSQYSNGSFPYVGVYWWEWADQPSLQNAAGLCTFDDNCYNGSDPTATSNTCANVTTPPNTCGSESGLTATITSFSITSNVVTLVATNTFDPKLQASNYLWVTASGLGVGTYLNGVHLQVTSLSGTQMTANFTHADVGSTVDSGSLGACGSGGGVPCAPFGATLPFGNLVGGATGVTNADGLWFAQNYGAAPSLLPPLNLGIVVH